MTAADDLPKWRMVLALAALFLSSMCTMGDLAISPIAANIYEAFADEPIWLINLGLTGPALAGLPFGVVTGFLCDRMDKKLIMVVGFAIFTFSAVFGLTYVNVYYFVVMRLFATGVGWGITNTAALSILADMFTDEAEHGKYVGWYNCAMSIIGAVLSSGAGMLALNGWTCAYQMYVIAIPVLVMLVVFLPAFPPSKYPDSAERVEEIQGVSRSSAAAIARAMFNSDLGKQASKGWWKTLVPLSIQVFVVAMLYYAILYMIALYVADSGVGDEAFTGNLMSIMTIATAVGSVVFGMAYRRFRTGIYLPALLVIALVFFLLALFPLRPVVMVVLAFAGFAWPFYFCFFYTHCTEIVPASKQSTATSIVAAANGLAVTASSYLLTGSLELTGGTTLTVYPYFGFMMLAVAAVSAIYIGINHRRHGKA